MIKLAKIKVGAVVFQDFSFPTWGTHIGNGEEDTLFEIIEQHGSRCTLRAWGYGLMGTPGGYGNGSISTDISNILSTTGSIEQVHRPKKEIKPDYTAIIKHMSDIYARLWTHPEEKPVWAEYCSYSLAKLRLFPILAFTFIGQFYYPKYNFEIKNTIHDEFDINITLRKG